MNLRLLFLPCLLSLLFVACCRDNDFRSVSLSDAGLKVIPYHDSQELLFLRNSADTIKVVVKLAKPVKNSVFDTCAECCDSKEVLEIQLAELKSPIDDAVFPTLMVIPEGSEMFSHRGTFIMNTFSTLDSLATLPAFSYLNYYDNELQTEYDKTGTLRCNDYGISCMDTLTVNGNQYIRVLVAKSEHRIAGRDTDLTYFYHENAGVLKIEALEATKPGGDSTKNVYSLLKH